MGVGLESLGLFPQAVHLLTVERQSRLLRLREQLPHLKVDLACSGQLRDGRAAFADEINFKAQLVQRLSVALPPILEAIVEFRARFELQRRFQLPGKRAGLIFQPFQIMVKMLGRFDRLIEGPAECSAVQGRRPLESPIGTIGGFVVMYIHY